MKRVAMMVVAWPAGRCQLILILGQGTSFTNGSFLVSHLTQQKNKACGRSCMLFIDTNALLVTFAAMKLVMRGTTQRNTQPWLLTCHMSLLNVVRWNVNDTVASLLLCLPGYTSEAQQMP